MHVYVGQRKILVVFYTQQQIWKHGLFYMGKYQKLLSNDNA